MKKAIFVICISLMLGMVMAPSSLFAWANGEAPWGAPVMPGGKVLSSERTAQVIE